ncbi:MAG: hypothetical protein HZB46_06960 [Solirubrobacterales bacterium]|nr:hypothetical protein [Solirubrobacterales bacterium]
MAGRRLERERRARARAQGVGAVGFLVAAALPVLLWHDVVAAIASEFELTPRYLVTGWSPWVLMGLGLVCLAVAGVIEWRNRERRFYAPGGGAWFGWGVSLYVLGFGLATQVAQIAEGLSAA